ncbi:hypothetical protein [Rhodoblastus sp.]|uniref:hypothetical protein n=1 Tax=Rhodoblastus sp. TaxID=1962975 RepID=UPI003F974D46
MLVLRVFALLLATQAVAWAGDESQVAAGRKLLAANHCNGSCHQSRAPGGNALNLYTRPNRKVQSLAQLKSQVEGCVANTNAMIAPDEIGAVVAALNADYYKFH